MFDELLRSAVTELGYTKVPRSRKEFNPWLHHLLQSEGIEVHVFPQTWPNASIGFGGPSGQMITGAHTTVVLQRTPPSGGDGRALVYFGGHLAYEAPTNHLFLEALYNRNMPEVAKRGMLLKEGPEEVGSQLRADLNLLERIDQFGKGLSPKEVQLVESFMRRVKGQKQSLTEPQRVIAREIDERRVS